MKKTFLLIVSILVLCLSNSNIGMAANKTVVAEVNTPKASAENKKITITWKKVKNADGYQIYRRESNAKKYTYLATRTKSLEYEDTDVKMGKKYYYKVRAYRKIDGKKKYGDFSKYVVQRAQVGKVSNVDAVGYTHNKVRVTWDKEAGADGYTIYRSTSEDGTYKPIKRVTSGNTLTYTNTKRACGRVYYYKVRAYKEVGDERQFGELSKADVAHPKPDHTTITNKTKTSATSITLKWKKAAGADGYAIYRNAGNGYKLVKSIKNKDTLSWKDTGLNKKKTYSYKIRAYVNVDGKRVYSHSYSNVYKKLAMGWRYVDGYKLYYNSKGEVVQDVRSIIGKQSSYVIKVNKKQCITTVYAKDGKNGYIIPVVAFVCSPGKGTPRGTFYTPAKYRWIELYGNVWGQWNTRITGHILFHSVYYTTYNNPFDLSTNAYNKLGSQDSMGCIRLPAGDAKWVYDNCKLNTKVVIYSSSKEEPLKKPTPYKLAAWHRWDPTDPTAKSRCKAYGCH